METFVSSPSVEQLEKCRKNDLINIAAYYRITVATQQLKREIKSAVIQRLVELGFLVLPARVEEDSLGIGVQVPLIGEEEQSGVAAVEGSEAKASLPPFETFTPTSQGSGGDARLKIRLAQIQMEAHEKVEERRAEMELRLEVRRLEIEAEKQIKLRELELNAAKNAPVLPVSSVQTADASAGISRNHL